MYASIENSNTLYSYKSKLNFRLFYLSSYDVRSGSVSEKHHNNVGARSRFVMFSKHKNNHLNLSKAALDHAFYNRDIPNKSKKETVGDQKMDQQLYSKYLEQPERLEGTHITQVEKGNSYDQSYPVKRHIFRRNVYRKKKANHVKFHRDERKELRRKIQDYEPNSCSSIESYGLIHPGCLELNLTSKKDAGTYTCRVEFLDSPTQTNEVILTVFGE